MSDKIGSIILGGSMFYISYHLMVTLKDIASRDFSPFYVIMWGIFVILSLGAAFLQLSDLFIRRR